MKSENRPTEFVLIGQPRTCTTYVMMLLNSHGDIFFENELFNPFGIVRAKAKQSNSDQALIKREKDPLHFYDTQKPSHVAPQILEALAIAAGRGLKLPLVYNTGGYESPEALKLLDGVVDIYMPDFKFWDPQVAERYCKATDYPEKARLAVKEMHRQVGDLTVDDRGIARRGLLIRHLVMPDGLAGTRDIMRFLATEVSKNTLCERDESVPTLW